MRELTDHKTNPANAELTITVCDEPGAGGASHLYRVTGFNLETNPLTEESVNYEPEDDIARIFILFQNGPIGEVGVNGVTHEALLAIVIDRLRSFQAGPYSCRENAIALTKCEEALMWLKKRTHDRTARGVEGTHQK